MQQNPQPPKDRVKRPELPNFQQFNQQLPPSLQNDEVDELSQEDYNEWVFRKLIKMELSQMRKEDKDGIPPKSAVQSLRESKPKPTQPYEQAYGKTEDELIDERKLPKPKKRDGKKIVYLVIFIAIACAIGYYAYKILVEGYSFGYLPPVLKVIGV